MATRQKVDGRGKQASQVPGASGKGPGHEAPTAKKRGQPGEGRQNSAENLKRSALDRWEDEGGSLAGTASSARVDGADYAGGGSPKS